MKQLDVSRQTVRAPVWPTDPSQAVPVFFHRRPLRKMVVAIDADLKTDTTRLDPTQHLDQTSLLSDLLDNELIRCFRYSPTGPPPGVQPVLHRTGVEAYPGWAIVNPEAPPGYRGVTVAEHANGYMTAGLRGNAVDVAENDTSTDAYDHLAPEEARNHRREDAIAAQVASQAVEADLYVTERSFLHKYRGYANRGTTVCTPAEALTLVGLYLRAQGEFHILNHVSFNRGLYFWVGTRDILPAAWRWFNACGQYASGAGDDSPPAASR